MKILVLSNRYPPDGCGTYEVLCRQAVDALRTRGHDVRVLTSAARRLVPSSPGVERTLQLTAVEDPFWLPKLEPVTQRMVEVAASLVNAHNIHRLLEQLEAFQPDVVYLHNLLGVGGLGLLGCLQYLRLPWVWQVGDHLPQLLGLANHGLLLPLVREFNRQVRGYYQLCSERLLQDIDACGIRLEGRVELLPSWFAGTPAPPRTAFFRKGGKLRIVNAGPISSPQGTDLLIEAAGLLRGWGYDNFSVDIYGSVNDPTFQCLIGKFRVEDRVRLGGPRSPEELLRLYRAYDVFAYPTWESEPLGSAALEAAAAGCVPLLAASCGLSEWLVQGVHCLKAPRAATEFAAVLRSILDGAVDLEPLAQRVQAVAWRDYHVNALLPRIEAALRLMAAQSRGRAGTIADAYRLARLAEKLSHVLVNEAVTDRAAEAAA